MLNKVKARFLIGVGGLIAVSFMVMIGYTIGSQTISKQTANQIYEQKPINLCQRKSRRKERQSYQMSLSKNFSLNISPRFSWVKITLVSSPT